MYQNYTINQLCLPIDLEIKLEENDFAHAIVQFVDSIPDEVFLPYYQSMGRPQYHPRMLLSIILCAYIQGVYSGRQIQNMLIDSIRMRYLSQEQFPNFRTINRFRVHPIMNDILDHSFVQFRELLVQSGLISGSALYIDGTKIEADANKYSFVWKKSILKYKDSLDQKALENYQQMVETKILPELIDDLKDELSIEEIERIRQSLEEKENQLIEAIDQTETVEERKLLRKEKSEVHKQKKRFDDFAQRKMSYEEQLVIMGVRNSFSKTDHDATFMRMKEDHMLNGQLKPGYNIQLATENQFALAYDCYPNPTDTRTFIPFLEKIESKIGLPENIVADAGYASEENYCYVLDETESTPIIPHQGYLKEKKRAHKQNQFHRDNWTYNELDDYYICPNQKRVVFSHY
ncbi:IS1182-like element IS1182 family transposase, partial [Staphylococcus pseudintermedius]|nr:IS1182-like element IS1182 family transposase [Staphylococcus pseudintermedius]